MNMRPPVPYQTDSFAEMMIFNHLKQSLVEENYTAMHSVLLSCHPTKRFGEIDFVICGRQGVFVLEIKGGQVSCQNGVWHYKDKHGSQNTGGSPFHQAHTALHGLRQSLSFVIDRALFDKICFGYGVILTDARLPNGLTGVEYDPPMLCQANQYKHLNSWLNSLFGYWQQRNKQIMPQVEQLNDDEITLIIGKIRPDFQAYKFTTTDINTPSIYPQSPKQSIISHISRKISYQTHTPKTLQELKQGIINSLRTFYENFVNGIYFSPKDISIITHTPLDAHHLLPLLNGGNICFELFDNHSFMCRQNHHISILSLDQLSAIDNKIILMVLPPSYQHDISTIELALCQAKLILHYFYYEFKDLYDAQLSFDQAY